MIRRAEKRDIPGLLRLLTQVAQVHHDGRPDLFKSPATKFSAEDLESLLDEGAWTIFVLTGDDDGRVLGHCFCEVLRHEGNRALTDIATLHIHDLVVDEEVRGQGLGALLYDHALAYARELGCHNLTLNVWTCNPAAVRFYERMGLRPQKIGMETVLDGE